jgi:hypothetical protein
MYASPAKACRIVLAGLLSTMGFASWTCACTATGGLDRYTLGLDPALACNDPKALRRVLAIELAQVAKAGDVLAAGGVLPLRTEDQYRFLRPQPIRGLRVTGIANRVEEGDRLVLAFNEPLGFLRPLYERAGWRFSCQRQTEGERCSGQREIVLADGKSQKASLEIVQLAAMHEGVRSYSVCSMPGLSRQD